MRQRNRRIHFQRDLGLICLIKKDKIRLRIQSWIFLKKRTLGPVLRITPHQQTNTNKKIDKANFANDLTLNRHDEALNDLGFGLQYMFCINCRND